MAWKVSFTEGLDGKAIKNIRYYCTVKDADLTDNAAPEYENYVYDYNVDLNVPQVYTKEVTASFDNAKSITLNGLPEDAEELTAKVYYTTGGRNATYTYLTPLVVDSSDDDIDPVFVPVNNGKIEIAPGSVTNTAGKTAEYGTPVDGTTYTVELSCNNYIIKKFTVDYTAPAEKNVQSPAKAEKAADDTIRFAAGIDSLNYKEVGFIFEADGKEVKRNTKTVYTSIADSEIATTDFEGAEYLYSFEISDIAETDAQIKVTPYYVDLNGNEVKAESSVYSLKDLSGNAAPKTLADDSASGSAVNVNTTESENGEAASENDIKEVTKEEAILNDVEIVTVEEVLD